MRGLLRDMGCDMTEPTVLWVDNSGAVTIAKYRESSQRSRHIERRFLKVQEWVEKGEIVVRYRNTTEQRADLMTKPLSEAVHEGHVGALMDG